MYSRTGTKFDDTINIYFRSWHVFAGWAPCIVGLVAQRLHSGRRSVFFYDDVQQYLDHDLSIYLSTRYLFIYLSLNSFLALLLLLLYGFLFIPAYGM